MLLPKIKKVKGHHKDLPAELQTCLELCFSDKKHGREGHSSHNHSRSRTWKTEFALVSFTLSHGKKLHQQNETVAIMIHFPPTYHSLCGAGSLATVGWWRGDHPPTEWNGPLRAPRGQTKEGANMCSSFRFYRLILCAIPDSLRNHSCELNSEYLSHTVSE